MSNIKKLTEQANKYGSITVTLDVNEVMNLLKERDALAALAEERRQFIVNGVEMGDILLPAIDGDPAIGIHERCMLKPKFAYDSYLNSVRDEALPADIAEIIDSGQL